MSLAACKAPSRYAVAMAWLEEVMGPSGKAVGAGYRFNSHQLDYAQRALEGFFAFDTAHQKTAINALEAATGLGKSLGYLSAAACYAAATGERVVIATHSRQLQRQLNEKDAPSVIRWVEEVSGIWLSSGIRIGKQNYVDQDRVDSLLRSVISGQGSPSVISFLNDLNAWLASDASTGILDDFLQAFNKELPSGITPAVIGLTAQSDPGSIQQYETDVAASKNVDILITNHALLVLHAFRWGLILDEEGGRVATTVIVDEAHRLPHVAESLMSEALSLNRASTRAAALKDLLEGIDNRAARRCQQLQQGIKALNLHLGEHRPQGDLTYTPAHHIEGLDNLLRDIGDQAAKVADALAPFTSLVGREQGLVKLYDVLDLCGDLKRISQGMAMKDKLALVSWSPVKTYPSLLLGNADAGRLMSRLWAPVAHEQDTLIDEALPPRPRLNSILLTSATLGAPGGKAVSAFDALFSELGIIRHRSRSTGKPVHHVTEALMARYEPSSFGSMHFVLADYRVPKPTSFVPIHLRDDDDSVTTLNKNWLAYAARMVQAATNTHGRALVLAHSWREANAIAELLGEDKNLPPLLVHREGQALHPLLKAYQKAPSILITPGGWDGVDLPGLVPALVILRIPFRPPNRPDALRTRVTLKEMGYTAEKIDNILFCADRRAAWHKLRQGLGRGIRHPQDECHVWIADPRFPIPEQWLDTFDPVLAKMVPSQKSSQHRDLLNAVPERFRDAYCSARIFNQASSALYQPEDW